MPTVNVNQLIGKTFFPRYAVRYYSVYDINNAGDKAVKTGVLQKNESFVMDSFLLPTEATTKNGIKYAKRSVIFFTFFRNGKYYGIKYDPNLYSLTKLTDQGVKTAAQEIKEAEEQNKTTSDKLTDTLTNLFTGAGKTAKTLLFIGIGIFAVGYLAPKFLKK